MHADISPDDLSSLSHEILQILPRGLDGKLISALHGRRARYSHYRQTSSCWEEQHRSGPGSFGLLQWPYQSFRGLEGHRIVQSLLGPEPVSNVLNDIGDMLPLG